VYKSWTQAQTFGGRRRDETVGYPRRDRVHHR
jgi:hypothetical protein